MESPPEWIHSVLKHGDLKTCLNLATVSKMYHQELTTSCSWWKVACVKFAEEKKLYLDLDHFESGSPSLDDWKDLFAELRSMRFQFCPSEKDAPAQGRDASCCEEEDSRNRTFSIAVSVRFRPPVRVRGPVVEGDKEQSDASQRKVVIPLHQRLPLIKAKYGMNLSNSEAMKKIMMIQHGKDAVADPWSSAFIQEDDVTQKENRTQQSEKTLATTATAVNPDQGPTAGIVAVKEKEATVLGVVPGSGLRDFKFDRVFDSGSSQDAVHLNSSRRVVMDFINGFNGTVMVYGQTGSGKTYTMFGNQKFEETFEGSDEDAVEGIAQKTAKEVLKALGDREDCHGIGWRLGVTYVEVYGQEVYDLLKGGEIVGQSRVAGQRYVLDGQTEWPVSTWPEISDYLKEGDAQKRKACTAMNERSSRAHTVFILSLTQTVDGRKVQSKLMLVDLGGSEKLTKSKVHESVRSAGTVSWSHYYEQRKHLTEALYINAGLYALKACIEALHEKQKQDRMASEDPSFKRRHIYVPYQDSKLTMLLSSSLGGSARTVMIVTASKDPSNATETFQSLRFGEQCSSVENTALCMSRGSVIDAINELGVRIKECEALIEKHERWETKRIVRKDLDGDEIVTVTVPVGAEMYREELERLLKRKDALLGVGAEEEEEATAEVPQVKAVPCVAVA
ncbi:kinesin [Chloropicon primus]|nr:kinesin [Chloropicon primus]